MSRTREVLKTLGMFVAVFIGVAGGLGIYENAVQGFIPAYSLHQRSAELHVHLALLAAGVTAIWRLRR